MGEKLYNGIELPSVWPPRDVERQSLAPIDVPYLHTPPEEIDISVGRQLFVDDFLIEKTSLSCKYHHPVKFSGNPILRGETEAETETLPCACPKSGGVWYDEKEKKFKMWYEAGWLNKLAYAESDDGVHWDRRPLDLVPGTNLIFPGVEMDSTAVFIDNDADPAERYKLFVRGPGGLLPGYAAVSADGIHWDNVVRTTPIEDRSTMFYNPFRKKWVYSIRRVFEKKRIRLYRECDDYLKGATWTEDEQAFWLRVDRQDQPDPNIGMMPQLYNFDAVAYESVMLGMFQIHLGPENGVCRDTGVPKISELQACYSRDGFHFYRPDRTAFIPASRTRGAWDRGYVQSVGGLCVIHEDEIWFYYIGFAGDEGRTLPYGRLGGMHDNAATGIAKLRRDGFASLRGEGFVQTRKLVCKDKRFLFVNAFTHKDGLRAELQTADGTPVPGYAIEDSIPMIGNSARCQMKWKDHDTLPDLQGKPFRLRFDLQQGDFYAFWLSADESGESDGMCAAGRYAGRGESK